MRHTDSHWHQIQTPKARKEGEQLRIICDAQGASRPFEFLRSAKCPDTNELAHTNHGGMHLNADTETSADG